MNRKLLLLAGFYLLTLSGAWAQAKKVSADAQLWADFQVDYFLKNQSFFYFQNQYRHNTDSDFSGIREDGALSNLSQVYFLVGYNQKLTDHWRGSFSVRYTVNGFNNSQIYQAALQHNGKIGDTDFIKRLVYDLMIYELGDGLGRTRPMAALERNFKIGNRFLRPHLSYELFIYNNFKEKIDPNSLSRTVDRTRLRLAASYQVSKIFWLTPFFIKQTEYYNVLTTYTGEFDANGNQIVKEEGGKRNRVEPVFGLEFRFLLPGRNVSENTIPNLGNLSIAPAETNVTETGL